MTCRGDGDKDSFNFAVLITCLGQEIINMILYILMYKITYVLFYTCKREFDIMIGIRIS